MKKILAALLSAFILAGLTVTPVMANDGTTTMYTTVNTVMYSGPSYTSPFVQTIPAGKDIICYARQQNGFINCFYDVSSGWIALNNLSNVLNGNNGGGQNNNLNGNYQTTMHTSESVNLRSGPGLKYRVITALAPDSPIYVYEVVDGWAECDYGISTHGFVSTDYIRELNQPTPAPYNPPVNPSQPGTTWYNGYDWSAVYNYNDYIAYNPDVARAYPNNPSGALQHFVTCGINEGRQASKNWNLQTYMSQHPDLVKLFGNNYAPYYKSACNIPIF